MCVFFFFCDRILRTLAVVVVVLLLLVDRDYDWMGICNDMSSMRGQSTLFENPVAGTFVFYLSVWYEVLRILYLEVQKRIAHSNILVEDMTVYVDDRNHRV